MEVEIRNDIQVLSAEKSDDEVGDGENKDEKKSDEEDDDKISAKDETNYSDGDAEELDDTIKISLSSEMGSGIKEEDDSVDSGDK